jgi:hypothetical protein
MVVALPRLKTYLFVALTLMTATPLVCLGVIEVDRWREAQRRDADKELTFTAEALFQDGISTALHVTALSGRGVGMSALSAAVTVRSTKGVGTGIPMIFPAA